MDLKLREQRREGVLVLMTTAAFVLALFFSHRSFVEAEKDVRRLKFTQSNQPALDATAFKVGGANVEQAPQNMNVSEVDSSYVPEELKTPPRIPSSLVFTPSNTDIQSTSTKDFLSPTSLQGTPDVIFGAFNPALEIGRLGHVAGFIDSRLLVACGTNGKDMLSSVEVFDYVSGEYFKIENSVIPRIWGSSVVWQKNLIILGGVNFSGNSSGSVKPVEKVEMVNALTLQTQILTNHPHPRTRAGAVLVGSKIFYIGGSTKGQMSGEVNIYDISANLWSLGMPMPYPREVVLAVNDGLIYAAGGRIPGVGTVYFHVYDPSTNTWTAKPALPEPRSNHVAFTAKQKIWLVGDDTLTNIVLVYEIPTSLWSRRSLSIYPKLPRYSTAAQVSLTGLLVGGTITDDNFPANEIWSININD